MMHGNVRAMVPDAHCQFAEPINKGSQRLSLLLADAYQGDGGQVMRPVGGKLSFELHHECGEAINGVGWELGKPAKGCSLQRCRKHLAQHCIVRGVETHMGGVGIHMLVRVG